MALADSVCGTEIWEELETLDQEEVVEAAVAGSILDAVDEPRTPKDETPLYIKNLRTGYDQCRSDKDCIAESYKCVNYTLQDFE